MSNSDHSLLAEITGERTGNLESIVVCDHICMTSIERLQFENMKLKVGLEEANKTIARLIEETKQHRASKKAILASWKYNMMNVRAMKSLERQISCVKRAGANVPLFP